MLALEDQTLLLVDGYHRVAAAQQAGRTTFRAAVRVGTKAEAPRFAVDVAQAEAGVSAEQARDAIRRYSGRQNKHEREQLTRRHPRWPSQSPFRLGRPWRRGLSFAGGMWRSLSLPPVEKAVPNEEAPIKVGASCLHRHAGPIGGWSP